MSVKKIILDVKIDGANEQINVLNALQEELNALSIQKKELAQAEKDLNQAIKDNTITEAEATVKAKELAAQQVELNLVTKESKKEYAEAEKALLNQGKAMDVNEGSIAGMRLELSKSQKEYINLSKAERENEQIGGVLQKRIKAQSDELKTLEKEIGITSRSVGDYGQAVSGVLPLMGGFGGQIQTVIGTMGQMKTALMGIKTAMLGTTTATAGASTGLKAFRVSLIATGIGAFVVLLGTLVGAFLSTQRGIDTLMGALAPLKEVFQSFIGYLQNTSFKVFDNLKKAIDNPKQALKDFGNFIVNEFMSRLKGFNNLIGSVASTIVNSFKQLGLEVKGVLADVPLLGAGIDKVKLKKDLEDAKKLTIKSAKDIATATIQTVTGMDKARQKEVGNQIKIDAERGRLMKKLQVEIEENDIQLNRRKQEGLRIFEQQKQIAENLLLSEKERKTAITNALNALEGVKKLEQEQLDRRIKLTELSQKANDTDREGQKELQELFAERERVEAELTGKATELKNKQNDIVRQGILAQKKLVEDQRKATELAEKEALQESLNNEKAKIEAQNKAYDETAKLLQQERHLEELTTEETAEMKLQKEVELQKKLSDLKLKQAKFNASMELKEEERKINQLLEAGKISLEMANEQKTEAKKQEGEKIRAVELENLIAESEILRDERVRQNEINTEIEVKRQEKEEERKKAVVEGAFMAIDTTKKIIVDNQTRRVEDALKRELDALTLQRQQGLITEEQYNAKRLDFEKEAFKEKQRIAVITALVDGGLAVAKTFATYPYPASIIPAALVAIQTAATVATIKAQKFQKGGVVKGKSHAQGGVSAIVGGEEIIELEGGEAIINKKATAKNLAQLSQINQEGGGVAFTNAKAQLTAPVPTSGSISKLTSFQNGGIAGGVNVTTQNINLDELAEKINTIKVVNVASETATLTNREIEIKNLSTF